MAPPTLPTYSSRSGNIEFDPATLSDDEDDNRSVSSRSTWASTSSATILGFSDGYVGRGGAELTDWRMSRIGGIPTFPAMFASQLEPNSTKCLSCSNLMPLLTQIYCPIDSSPLERILYVFGCPRSSCRTKDGSVRCWRASVPWIEEDSDEENLKREEEEKLEIKKESNQLGNLIFGGPSTTTTSSTPSAVNFNPFAPATPITTTSNPFVLAVPNLVNSLESISINPTPSTQPTKTPRIKSPLPPSPTSWSTSTPSFPPQYLTTAYEPPSNSNSTSIPSSAILLPTSNEDQSYREGKGAGGRVKKGANVGGTGTGSGVGGDDWSREGYEVQKVKGVDDVFLGFQERVSREGKQCIRYDHSSTPLPFSSTSRPYLTLFPTSATTEEQGFYTPSILSPCPHCQQSKTFELQLMPYLVSLLNKSMSLPNCTALVIPKEEGEGDAEKGKKKKNVLEEDGLDFASVWIFTCLGECLKDNEVDGWREESVMIEWEDQ